MEIPQNNDYCEWYDMILRTDINGQIKCDTCEINCVHSKKNILSDYLVKSKDDTKRCKYCRWFDYHSDICRKKSIRISGEEHNEYCFEK